MNHPGIIFRGPPHDRRASLAAGPDIWEIIARLRELDGSEEQRIATLAEDLQARIQGNQAAVEASRRAVEQRHALLA